MIEETKEENLRNLIIFRAAGQFFNYGFANTTTQQIAEELEISKKTLYKYFASKEELLFAVLDLHHREMEERIHEVIEDNRLDFVEKLKEVTKVVGAFKAKFSPQFLRDLQKVAPGQWKDKESIHQRFVPHIERLLHEGVQAGMLRNDVDVKMIILIVSSAFENFFNLEPLSRFSFSFQEGIDAILKVVTEGILTERGRENFLH